MTEEEIINLVRLVMGNPAESVLPTTIIQLYVEQYQILYPDSDCKVLYNTILSCYQWLIGQSSVGSSGGGKRREKNGKREVEIEGYNKSGDWKAALSNFLKNPSQLLPQCAVEFGENKGLGRVIVGGVNEDLINSINDDPNRRTGGANEKTGVTYSFSSSVKINPNNSFRTRKD